MWREGNDECLYILFISAYLYIIMHNSGTKEGRDLFGCKFASIKGLFGVVWVFEGGKDNVMW